ncbi:YcnI family copper-binding membrane protein [Leifsonia sp. 22587]|uniref:YcnI family copper-binding membrane protein n=1 Tax=Leifsonia sp. 22587 TaxID=3453946 RepID=UPI003F86E99C
MKKSTFAASAAAASTALLLLASPLAASAHVHVDPDQASPGSYTNLTFKVPTESATAGTVKLVVDLPTKTPFTSVSYLPLAGWTTTVDTEKLAKPVKTDDGTITEAPIRITWTADSGVQIAPGQFQQFTVSAGAIPKTGSIELPTHQYYSDGTVVDWDQPTPASGDEPEHPAPTLYIEDAAPAEDGSPTLVATPAPVPAAATSTTATVVSIAVGVGGLALGAIALVVAVFALTRVGRRGERKVQG